ncbi:Fe(3+) dicitrate ABC transporter substrate-binding protein [Marinomonas sp.]
MLTMWLKRSFLLLGLIANTTMAVTVKDMKGDFTLEYVPQRIVALEYSFVDALAIVDISPIGIADDKDKTRILSAVRQRIAPWTSVGTRSQPSLEMIASLKPDLIIADIGRHAAVYSDLQKIAPTLMLKSRHDTYDGHLKAASLIGQVVGHDAQMQARLAQHKVTMAKISHQLPQGIEVQFGIALDDYMALHPGQSYVGTLLQSLGFKTPTIVAQESSSVHTGLEQLLANNPEYLIIGHYQQPDISTKWQQEPLWQLLQAVRNKHVYHIDNPSIWSRSRGVLAAEAIGQTLVSLLKP